MRLLKALLIGIYAFVTIIFLGVACMAMAGQIYNVISGILA